MKENYKNYFRDHYRSAFTEKDISLYKKWFYAQWNFINSKLKINQKDNVLEIGSAMGGFYSYLKEKTSNYTGVEVDGEMVQFTNKYFKKELFVNTKIEDVTTTNKYDYVFAFEVLEHLEDPMGVVKKIKNMLHKNGTFCGTSPYPYDKNVIIDKTHLFVLHPKSWERLFLYNGFKSVEIYPMSYLPVLWKINKHMNIRIPFYIPIPGVISTCLIIAKK